MSDLYGNTVMIKVRKIVKLKVERQGKPILLICGKAWSDNIRLPRFLAIKKTGAVY